MNEVTPYQNKKFHVLVIDDDKVMRDTLTVMLENRSISVMPISGSISAFQMISDRKPDLIILDYMMPGLSGFEFLRSLKLSPGLSNIPVLMLTGSTRQEDRETAISYGVTDFVLKPFDPDELMEKIDGILKRDSR